MFASNRHRGSRRALAVLLVDSAYDNRAMYAECLRAARLRTIEIDSTTDALALAGTVDAVVTEIRVPGSFDGLELVRRLRAGETTRRTPVVVLTACAFTEDERRARAAGCDVFLTKPCLPETLVAELRRLFALHRLPSPRAGAPAVRSRRDVA